MDPEFEAAAVAIYIGALADLERALDADPELATKRSSHGHPTLLQLVACEAADIVDPNGAARMLVDRGAKTWSPVVAAAGCNSASVLQVLIDMGADYDGPDVWTPLEEALYWANDDTVHLLLEHGAPIRSLAAAAGLGDVETLNELLGDDAGQPPVGPIRSPFPDTVPEELATDPQSVVNHAFVMAANAGQLDAARRLHQAGAKVNAKPPGYHWHGTALHAACWRGAREMVAWLLSVGADPSMRDGLADADAAGWANHHGHPELVPLLENPAAG